MYEAVGIAPLRPELNCIDAMKTLADGRAETTGLRRYAIHAGFVFDLEVDPKNGTMMIAGNGQTGLGLLARDYGLKDDEKSKTQRGEYVAHIAKMFELVGGVARVCGVRFVG